MSITFGRDGTLYCATVKYNWKQARNLIADGCYANTSGIFRFANGANTVNDQGYKTYRSFHFPAKSSQIEQDLPTPIANHKYYGACRWKTAGSSFSVGDARFEWWCNDTASGKLVFADKTMATNGQWVLLSSIKSLSSVASGSWMFRNFVINPSTESWCTRMMIIDLTDTFGAGNEPTKEWCDANIREHETYVNFGSMLSAISNTNFSDVYVVQQGSCTFQRYLDWNRVDRPREYTVTYVCNKDYAEGFLRTKNPTTEFLDPSETYYASMETSFIPSDSVSSVEPQSYQYYWPIEEPSMGSVSYVNETLYNGGGGMSRWKRASFFADRSSFVRLRAPMRWDFDNANVSSNVVSTGHQMCKVSSNIAQYNKYNKYNGITTEITINDVNKAWCDRWIDNRGFSYVHIKDPHNTEIRITPDSELVCNDVEIRPEVNSISFKPDGTVVCKKLVKTFEY